MTLVCLPGLVCLLIMFTDDSGLFAWIRLSAGYVYG